MENEIIESNDNNLSIDDIENLLDDDIVYNKKEKWNKLDKTQKYKKLILFANEYDEHIDLKDELKKTLISSLEQNKFSKISDVNYDSNTGKILSIPSLLFIENEFVIKQTKRTSTSKSLPKKILKTKRNKDNI
jgi:hypothetical protein